MCSKSVVESENGFTLMEIMVAMMILALCLTAVFELFSGGLRAGVVAEKYLHAVYYAEEEMETFLLDTTFTEHPYLKNSRGDYTAVVTAEPFRLSGNLNRSAQTMLYKITVLVSWSSKRQHKTVSLNTLQAGPIVLDDTD